jgi:hypothetical protein
MEVDVGLVFLLYLYTLSKLGNKFFINHNSSEVESLTLVTI